MGPNIYRDYLGEIGLENTVLEKFWFEVHTQRPSLCQDEIDEAKQNNADLHSKFYTIMTLRNLHNCVSWCLQQKGKNINLTTDPKFVDSKIHAKNSKELTKERYAVIQKKNIVVRKIILTLVYCIYFK